MRKSRNSEQKTEIKSKNRSEKQNPERIEKSETVPDFIFFEMVTALAFPGTVLSGKSYTILNEKWYNRNNM